MSRKREVQFFVFNPMHFDGLIIRACQQQLTIIAVIKCSNGRIVSLDGKRVPLSVVGPDLNSLILRCTRKLVPQRRKLDIRDCILNMSTFTLCPMYLKMLPEELRFHTKTMLSLEPVAICLLRQRVGTIGDERLWC